jgi:hypothetical protein
MPDAERPYRAFGYPPAFYIVVATAMYVAIQTSAVGRDYVTWNPVYYLVKKKE